MRLYKLALLATSVSLITACASASNGTAAEPATAAASSTTTISADDIARINVATAYDAIDRLHRRWFHSISVGSSGDAVIYLNEIKVDGGKEALREIPVQDVVRIDYLKSADAVARFGPAASGGAILVTRR